ncbi:hypothetical protein [Paucibacter sp. Y2R2-4]|uniref:hypothetical protein n=1 Tax=Paucibacter sp. Y2R2-4 TaxID=2893553 RepID=UPI0021E4CBED|nr:hypothetical protein [Paucibacter sp. Y2R2-4]MCV2350693.1 hypothetical protein [Paucibacter sp. Y2R2-4]
MNSSPKAPQSRAPRLRRERQWTQQLRQELREQHALRAHVFVIASLSLAGLLLFGALLRWAGIESLAWRYAAALPLSYLLYLGLLRLWADFLLGKRKWDGDGLDLVPDINSFNTGGINTSGAHTGGGFSSGSGGDFGGAGASGDFSEVAADLGKETLSLSGKALGAVGDADEGAVVAVPLIAVLAIIGLLAALLGTVVFMLFGVEVLMAVAVEVALASTAGGLAYRAERAGWLGRVLSHTWRGALITVLLGVALGLAIDHWLPAADSLPQALHLLMGKA